jgi:membrane fusion protein, adhesin transport system
VKLYIINLVLREMLDLNKLKNDHSFDESSIHSLQVLHMPKYGKILARWLVGISFILFLTLFLPWQQNITGFGKVTTLRPEHRPQTVETTIAGRIEKWNVREGQYVSKGDTILTISEVKDSFFNPELLTRLSEQITAKEGSIISKEEKAKALERQLVALNEGMKFKIDQARNKLEQARLKLVSDSMDYEAEKVNFEIAKLQFDRQQALYDKGLKSLTELEARKWKLQESQAKLLSTQNKFMAAKNERENAVIQFNSIRAEYNEKIGKAESDLSSTRADVYDGSGSLAKLRNDFSNMEIRNKQYNIIAPQDGIVVKALKAGIGETIKEGEAVVTIMPDRYSIAIEMNVKPMDVPLLTKGRKVRIEFDGWPALQFSGWPSVAVGTFGGLIEVIDFVNNTDGSYRVLVIPDPDDEPWPEQLRMGSGIYGWAMLDEVPIWYEIWRQLNGFPPSLKEAPAVADIKK